MKKYKFIIIAVIAVLVLIIKSLSSNEPKEEKTPEQIKQEQIATDKLDKEEKRAKKIDWALTTLKEMIKKRMNDPDSFQMIERLHYDKDKKDIVKLIIEYSGKNAFGGRVKNVAFGRYSLSTDKVWFVKSAD